MVRDLKSPPKKREKTMPEGSHGAYTYHRNDHYDTSAGDIMEYDVARDLLRDADSYIGDDVYNLKLSEAELETIQNLANRIDESDTRCILSFGTSAQHELSQVASNLMTKVKHRDLTGVTEDLQELIGTANSATPKSGILSILPKFMYDPVKQISQRYDTINEKIDTVMNSLMIHYDTLAQSTISLDHIYHDTTRMYKSLFLHIKALDLKITEYEIELKEQAEIAENAEADEKISQAQKLDIMWRRMDQLSRQRETLHQAQTIAAQDMPILMSMKDTDEALMGKVLQSIQTSIPMWKRRLAVLIEAEKTASALALVDNVGKFNDKMVRDGTKKIRELNREARIQVNKSLVSVDTLEEASQDIIADMKETLQLEHAARVKRNESAASLDRIQLNLAKSLVQIKNDASNLQIKDASKPTLGIERMMAKTGSSSYNNDWKLFDEKLSERRKKKKS